MAVINTFFECEVLDEAPGKIGRGLFAEKDLKAGHLVISEEPQMRFGSMAEVTKESVKSKWNVMQRAGDPVEFDLLELSHQADINASFEEKIHSIYMSNCLETSAHEGGEVFLTIDISIINHSCIPNATWRLNQNRSLEPTSVVEVRLVTDVKRGEEITISYCALDAEVLCRQHFLNERYGFYCQCEACVWGTPFYQASQFRRHMIRVIGMDIKTTDWRNTQDGEAILQGMVTTWENTVTVEGALPFLWEVYAIGEFAARTNGFSLLSNILGEKLYNIVVMHTGKKCDAFIDTVSRLDLFFPQRLNTTSRLA
ncbi:hypothetical protein MFRU_003g03700 [Monilinia fructicola]|uniref:SET domain-containing protein n=1 Tax=Monilinia fructicola TaxID=38448 RepID=A0A5M9JSE0_MONFR|nr:hypothetical protein EYC84_003026 [Monilinia fructicola]KAG4034405.1 hypothetical protein MFRU_003g03700 [Monilinia fructicola]